MSPYPYDRAGREALVADLNPEQREAVIHPGGPLLVVAGAGTGKTRVLTRRVAWLVAGGLPPRSVLAVTFTNKAARVLRDRLARLLGGAPVEAGTFHAFGARLLRRYGSELGIDGDFTVVDRDDQRRLIRDLLTNPDYRPFAFRPAEVGDMISHRKNGGGGRAPLDLGPDDRAEAFGKIEQAYAARLRAGHLLDFDDLLVEALRLLREGGEVGEGLRRRYAHVLVDEYQDTNLVQAEILRALLTPAANLTAVGDPDQSIYRWRGATVKNILDFEKDHPGARRLVLEQNYRSTRSILDAAEHVIARNQERHAKRLRTENPPGDPLVVVRARDADDEASVLAERILRWRADGVPPGEIAVFYRVNALSRAIELALKGRGVPYAIVAGVEFFQRREVKDLLAYARLAENPRDEAAFLRAVNIPRRGIGEQSIRRLRRAASERSVSLWEASLAPPDDLSRQARKGLGLFLALIEEARTRPRSPVGPFLSWLAGRSGYLAWLEEQDEDLELARSENVNELVAFGHDFDERTPEATLASFLEQTALVSDQDAVEEDAGRVLLMSVHAAKGLEFDAVAIAGAEDGLFPHARSFDDPAGAEEERRLFYVAMTRARRYLMITHAARRFDWRGPDMRLPSPYLADIPEEVVACEDRLFGAASGSLAASRPRGAGRELFDEADPFDTGMPVVRECGRPFVRGERVRHPYFGEGVLADAHGRGANARVTVDFDEHGRKQLLLSHARLERVVP